MITLIPSTFTGPIWATVDFGDGASIELGLRRPNLGEQIIALEESDSSREYHLRAYISDWRGVNDEHGKPVPYTWESLNQLCTGYPSAIWGILDAIREVRFPDVETTSKNSELPLLAGGTTTNDEITNSTTLSDCTVTSDASSDSATPSP